MKMNINDRINNNQGVVSNGKKTKLEKQIAQLHRQEQQINQQLKSWQVKQAKSTNFLNQLYEIDRFGNNFLNELLTFEKNKANPDS